MTLAEKLEHLRAVEGQVRQLGRPLTKADVVRLMRQSQGSTLSHAYLSQLESGRRHHLTQRSRSILAEFFHVHPGYLVSDPEHYATELSATYRYADADREPHRGQRDRLVSWLLEQAHATEDVPDVSTTLARLAVQDEPMQFFELLGELLALPPAALHDVRALVTRRGGDQGQVLDSQEIGADDV